MYASFWRGLDNQPASSSLARANGRQVCIGKPLRREAQLLQKNKVPGFQQCCLLTVSVCTLVVLCLQLIELPRTTRFFCSANKQSMTQLPPLWGRREAGQHGDLAAVRLQNRLCKETGREKARWQSLLLHEWRRHVCMVHRSSLAKV